MNTRRPLTVILAIVLLILLSVFGLILTFSAPLIIALYGFIVLTAGSLIAALGLWNLRRWGWLLTSVLSVLNMLVAVSGLWLASGIGGKVVSLVLALLFILVLVLVALPATRKAVAAKHVRAAA
jgi:hypothetical protein